MAKFDLDLDRTEGWKKQNVKLDGTAELAPLLVLGGVAAAIFLGSQQQQQGTTSTVTINITSDGTTPVSGTITFGSYLPQDGSSAVFDNVPYTSPGTSYPVSVTNTGFPDFNTTVTVDSPANTFGLVVGTFTAEASVTLSGGVATETDLTFSSVVASATGSVPISYVWSILDTTGAPVQTGTFPETEADGTYSVTVLFGTALTAGTYEFIVFPTDPSGNSLGNKLDFTQAVVDSGGLTSLSLTAGTLTATDLTIIATATPASFSGQVGIIDQNGTNIGIMVAPGNGLVTRLSTAQTVHINSGSINSNPVNVPAATGVILTALSIAAGAVTASTETVSITATPLTFSGTVALRDAAGNLIHNVGLSAGKGSYAVPRTNAQQVVHASFNTGTGLVQSGPLTIPALGGGGGLTALAIAAGTLTATAETVNVTATPLTFAGTVALRDATTGVLIHNVALTAGRGSFAVPRTSTAQTVQASFNPGTGTGLIQSGTLRIPALGGVTLTVLRVALGATTATTARVNVTATPANWSGTVALNRNSADIFVVNATITNGTGFGIVPRLASGVQNSIHAFADTIRSNNVAIPPLASGGGIRAALSAGTYNAASAIIGWTSVITGSTATQQVVYNYAVHNTAGQPVQSGTVPTNESNGTYRPFFNLASHPAGNYTAIIFATDSAGGSISGTLTFPFTIAATAGLRVNINGATGNATQCTGTFAVSGAAASPGSLIIFNTTIRNTLGQPVRSGTHNVQHVNGSYTESIFTYAAIPSGTYNCTTFCTDSNGGSISGTLNFSITV